MAAAQPTPQAPARYVHLDGLRGLAALTVAFSHYMSAFQLAVLTGDAAQSHMAGDYLLSKTSWVIFFSPDFGVAIFFILSGFVLAAAMSGNSASWPALALRRWVRLILPVLAVTILAWGLVRAGAYGAVQEAARQTQSLWLANIDPSRFADTPLWALLLNGLYSFFVPRSAGNLSMHFNQVLWTMPIELDGSLALFAAYCLRARMGWLAARRGLWALLAILAAVLLFQTKFYGFALGVAIYEIKALAEGASPAIRRALGKTAWLFGLLLLANGLWMGSTPYWVKEGSTRMDFLVFLQLHFGWEGYFGWPQTIIQMQHLGAACLVASSLLLAPLRWLLATRPVRFLGRISFMLYLLQLLVLCTAGVWVFLLCPAGWGYEPRAAVAFGVFLVLTILAAMLATRFIDEPSIRLSRRVTARHWGLPARVKA